MVTVIIPEHSVDFNCFLSFVVLLWQKNTDFQKAYRKIKYYKTA